MTWFKADIFIIIKSYRAMHFVLFCVRCRVAYNSGFGRSPWALPVGQLKFEVSIKFVREPEREAGEVTV